MDIRPASIADTPAIRNLLAACDLPAMDIEDHLEHFFVAYERETLAGVVGLEVRHPGGLLRSLAVDPSFRGTGLGKALTRKILDYAVSLGLTDVGLLTTTAETFFEREGFTRVEPNDIPDFVASSAEYRLYCPSTAVCMTRRM